MILRCYDPQNGEISINRKNLGVLDLRNYRRKIGYIGQEPCLLQDSIRNNLLLAHPDATEEEMLEALKSARALDFVQNLENGLDTCVGNIGGKLSGGQKQRIAIARALIKKPDLLIFDEATSALDLQNEAEVEEAITTINEESTITRIVIAHRISAILNADKIFVMKEGEIEAEGTNEELLTENKFYYEAFHSQSEMFRTNSKMDMTNSSKINRSENLNDSREI